MVTTSARSTARGRRVTKADRLSFEGADRVIANVLLHEDAPADWRVYYNASTYTPWRYTQMEWFVESPTGAIAVFYVPESGYGDDDDTHDMGLLVSGQVDRVVRLPTSGLTSIPQTCQIILLAGLQLGLGFDLALPTEECDKFTSSVKHFGDQILLHWEEPVAADAAGGDRTVPVSGFGGVRSLQSETIRKRIEKSCGLRDDATIEQASQSIERMAHDGTLGARFTPIEGEGINLGVESQALGVTVWLESMYFALELDKRPSEARRHPKGIVIVVEDDRLLTHPEEVAMRIRVPVAARLRGRGMAGMVNQTTAASGDTIPDGSPEVIVRSPTNAQGPVEPLSSAPSCLVGAVNSVTIAGVLDGDILFVESTTTNGRAQFTLVVERSYGGNPVPIPCTAFGDRSLNTLRAAIAGDYIVVWGELRAYNGGIYVYVRSIAAIVPSSVMVQVQ